ncbi:MAG TPA: hypothetical protein VHI93_03925, partial [Candidatus Thermoplasmatota archaeon]|nr:hypothetical protein [Candidatus Thermoplasmatota archaeon]
MPRSHLTRDEEAAASGVVTFLVAGVIFIGSIGAVLLASRDGNTGVAASNAPAATLNVHARSLAHFLLDSPGYSSTGGDWTAGGVGPTGSTAQADGLKRLGLKDDGPAGRADPSLLNFSKFVNLRMAPYAANHTDGYVNYEEARAGLGLVEQGLDFHIRAYPTLKSVQEMLRTGYKDPNLRVAYVGDIEVQTTSTSTPGVSTAGLTFTTPACTADAALHPKAFRISTTIRNGGTTPTQFTAVTSANLGASVQAQNTNGGLVGPGEEVTLSIEVAALSGRSCGEGRTVTFDLYDPVHSRLTPLINADTGASTDTISHTFTAAEGAAAGTPATAPRGLYIDTDRQSYRPTDRIVLNYDGTNLGNNDRLFLRVCKGTAECTAAPDLVYKKESGGAAFKAGNSNNGRSVDIGTLPAGNYTAWLYDCESVACGSNNPAEPNSNHLHATEKILVTAAAIGGYTPVGTTTTQTTYTSSGAGATEISFLEALVAKFCPSFFDSQSDSPLGGWDAASWGARCTAFKQGQAQPGDVFPDSKKVMNDDLPARLLYPSNWPDPALQGKPRYDLTNVLVVGSGVDQNAMTSGAAKFAVRDWVLGGGSLVVFGSEDQNVNWLQPLFHAAIRSSSGGLSVPDPGHPVLHSADELDYPHYSN